jgi:carboxylesterase type B
MAFKKCLFAVLIGLHRSSAQSPTVTLDTGVWKGVPTQQAGSSVTVHKYLGLPFAAPPLRFGAPNPPVASTAQKNADTLPPACIQAGAVGGFSSGGPPSGDSEDCLYLNLFAPAPTNITTAGKSVLVWFFGGALQFGTGSLAGYDGTSFATNQDIILIAPNYRTNVFGFPGEIPGVPIRERNLGFLDQRMALEWVQQNIAKFGGDPKKVTIFGESAGARSVNFHLLTNNPKNPPFRGVIMQSGSAHISPGVAVPKASNAPSTPKPLPFVTVAGKVGCSDEKSIIECMRKVPADQIKKAAASTSQFGAVDDDGFTTVRDAERVRKEHLAGNVSLLIGTDADEQKATMSSQRQTTFNQYLDSTPWVTPKLKEQLIKAYPFGPNQFYKNDYDAMVAIATDVGFTCVTSRESKVSAEAGYREYLELSWQT